MFEESTDEKMSQSRGVHWALDWMADHGIMSDRTAEMYHRRMGILERGWIENEKGVSLALKQHKVQAD